MIERAERQLQLMLVLLWLQILLCSLSCRPALNTPSGMVSFIKLICQILSFIKFGILCLETVRCGISYWCLLGTCWPPFLHICWSQQLVCPFFYFLFYFFYFLLWFVFASFFFFLSFFFCHLFCSFCQFLHWRFLRVRVIMLQVYIIWSLFTIWKCRRIPRKSIEYWRTRSGISSVYFSLPLFCELYSLWCSWCGSHMGLWEGWCILLWSV